MAETDNSRRIEEINDVGDIESDFAVKEAELKRDKARAKSNFTRNRNKLLSLIDDEDLPSRRAVREACQTIDTCMQVAMDVITDLMDIYKDKHDVRSVNKVGNELEKLEIEFDSAHASAKEYMDAHRDELSSVTSEQITIDLLSRMDITDNGIQRNEQQPPQVCDRRQSALNEVRVTDFNRSRNESKRITMSSSLLQQYVPSMPARYMHEQHEYNCVQGNIDPHNSKAERQTFGENVASGQSLNRHVDTSVFTGQSQSPSIGHDMWKQLKLVQIPVFAGDKRAYQSWKAAFLACIDNAPATAEYKLLQLRQYLAGEALKVIENLGHSATAYQAAKERLERKYGGKRRQIALYLEDLENFHEVRIGNARDIEQFSDLLDISIINLQEAGQYHELGDGSLYTKLQRKLPEAMLARYHRWVFEHSMPESVITLREWVIQESEFQTIASETVHGLTGKAGYNNEPTQPVYRNGNQGHRAFFGINNNRKASYTYLKCKVCSLPHSMWMCHEFLAMHVAERWNVAKRHHLCYRCLGNGHLGKLCLRSRQCGLDGCQDVHHRLLHKYNTTSAEKGQPNAMSTENRNKDDDTSRKTSFQSAECSRVTSASEGKEHTTMMAQSNRQPDLIGLRTVPIILQNGNRSLKVNALLDDASTKTYINADIAEKLGLQGKTERVTVNVLNGQVETFETTPVNVRLESLDGTVNTDVAAYTANRVTGNLQTINWNELKHLWRHLESIDFPRVEDRSIVDVLIGIDCAELHYALREVRGMPGQPVARLTPLGWTCIGYPNQSCRNTLQTNFSCTYFIQDQPGIEELNPTLRTFWKAEDVSVSGTRRVEKTSLSEVKQVREVSLSETCRIEKSSLSEVKQVPAVPLSEMCRVVKAVLSEARKVREVALSETRNCQKVSLSEAYVNRIHVYQNIIGNGNSKIVLDSSKMAALWFQNTNARKKLRNAIAISISYSQSIGQYSKKKYVTNVSQCIANVLRGVWIADNDVPDHRFPRRGIMDRNRPPEDMEHNRVMCTDVSPVKTQILSQKHAKKHQHELTMTVVPIHRRGKSVPLRTFVIEESIALSKILNCQIQPFISHVGVVIMMTTTKFNAAMGNTDVSDEQLMAAKTVAEARDNSGTLTYRPVDTEDGGPSTPTHVLYGHTITHHLIAHLVGKTHQLNPQKSW